MHIRQIRLEDYSSFYMRLKPTIRILFIEDNSH